MSDTCAECEGVGEACICDDLERVLDDIPDAPDAPHGSDWGAWLQGVIRKSNRDHVRSGGP